MTEFGTEEWVGEGKSVVSPITFNYALLAAMSPNESAARQGGPDRPHYRVPYRLPGRVVSSARQQSEGEGGKRGFVEGEYLANVKYIPSCFFKQLAGHKAHVFSPGRDRGHRHGDTNQRRRGAVTNDCEHLLISLAFITWEREEHQWGSVEG